MHYQDNRVSLCVITNNPDILKHFHDSPGIRLCIITTIQAFVCNITTIQVICALSQQSRSALSRQSRYLYALSLQSRYPFMRYHDSPGLRLCIITTIQVSLCIITQEETELRSRRSRWSWISETRGEKRVRAASPQNSFSYTERHDWSSARKARRMVAMFGLQVTAIATERNIGWFQTKPWGKKKKKKNNSSSNNNSNKTQQKRKHTNKQTVMSPARYWWRGISALISQGKNYHFFRRGN